MKSKSKRKKHGLQPCLTKEVSTAVACSIDKNSPTDEVTESTWRRTAEQLSPVSYKLWKDNTPESGGVYWDK